MMDTQGKHKSTEVVESYNHDTYEMLTKSLRYGSMFRPRATLAELAGIAVNDNEPVEG
jgi:hypothetical protein